MAPKARIPHPALDSGLTKQRLLMLAGVAAIAVMTIASYIPAIRAGFVWDDDEWVETNHLLSAPDGMHRIWFSLDQPSQYFPMVYTTFRLEYAIWGLSTLGYHLTNVVLHVINALLVWFLLWRLRTPGAWAAAAIFALHPVHVESVAWVTERKNVLMMVFFMLSLAAWIEFTDRVHRSRRAWHLYALSLLLYALALLSKTTACTLPAALVLVLWIKDTPLDRRRWLEIIPYSVPGLAMGLLTMWWEQYHQGTRSAGFMLGPIERVLVAGRAVWFYLGKLLWPVNLCFSYGKWAIDRSDPVQYGWLLACLAVAFMMWRWRRAIGRGPVAAIGFFVATLTPMLGVFMLATFVYTYVADHYQYVASVGPISLIAGCGTLASRRLGKAGQWAGRAILCVLLATLAGLTWQQSGIYKDRETLWRDTVNKNPDSFMAHNNLGTQLRSQGKLDEAVSHYRRALELAGRDTSSYLEKTAYAHYNLGNVLRRLPGKLDESIEHYRQAVQIKPDYVLAYNNLGNALLAQGRTDEAITNYLAAVRIDPGYADGQYNLAYALESRGRFAEAVEHYRIAVRLDPGLLKQHPRLAGVLATVPPRNQQDPSGARR